jgi:hypothetical protein
MNPQLLRAIAVERMDEIGREAERRRRMGETSPSHSVAKQNGRPSARRVSVRASIRRLQPGS